MSTYTYLTADLRTNAILAELPLHGVNFDRVVNGAGTFAAILPVNDSRLDLATLMNAIQMGRTAYYIDRDGVLQAGGVIWQRNYDSDAGSITLGGQGFLSYFARRRIRWSGASYLNTDQLAIAQSLVTTAQSVAGGNIGVNVGTETSGVLRNAAWDASAKKPVLEAINDLAIQSAGFDYAIDVAYVAGVPTKTLNLSYPSRGRRYDYTTGSGLVAEFPGNIVRYKWPEDASGMANILDVTGAGTGDGQARATGSATSLIDAGYPLLEDVLSYPDISDPTTLQSMADGAVKNTSIGTVAPTVVLRADMDPVLGAYIEGDSIRIRITDTRFPAPGLDTVKRIVKYRVLPGDDTAESVELTLGEVVS